MECKKCGAVTIEGATFCGRCGARIDGKIVCPACERLNEEESVYCVYCGTRIDGKAICEKCGTAHDGAFCPNCGKASEEKVMPVAKKLEKATEKQGGLLKKISEIISGAMLMVGVFLSIIFVFLISVELSSSGISKTRNIFYYFGDFYDEFDKIKKLLIEEDATKWFQTTIDTYGTVQGIIGTILSALILLCVIGFGIVAIVQYIVSWVKGKEYKSHGFALACIFSFLAGVALFYAYNAMAISIIGEALDDVMEVKTRFGGASITAIVLIVYALTARMVFYHVAKKREIWTKSNLSKIICSFIGLALASVLFIFAYNCLFALKITAGDIDESGTVIMKGAFLLTNEGFSVAFAEIYVDKTIESYPEITAILARLNVYNLLAQLGVICLIVFVAVSLIHQLRGTEGGEASGVLWASLACASSILLLVFSICASVSAGKLLESYFLDAAGANSSSNFMNTAGQLGIPICCVVFSLLLTGASITRACIKAKREETLLFEEALQ